MGILGFLGSLYRGLQDPFKGVYSDCTVGIYQDEQGLEIMPRRWRMVGKILVT